MHWDALALSGDASTLHRDALALSGDALTLHRDALALSDDALTLHRDALALSDDALTLQGIAKVKGTGDWGLGIGDWVSNRSYYGGGFDPPPNFKKLLLELMQDMNYTH